MKRRILLILLVLVMLFSSASLCSCEVWDHLQDVLLGGGDTPKAPSVSLDSIPEFDGSTPFVFINDSTPFFEESDHTTTAYESYGALDKLGRCTVTMACIGKELMPAEDEERGNIGSVHPTGWEQNRYDSDLVEGGWLYNRAHLIGWQLTAENANENNLITGTRYFNFTGMLPFENMVADYIRDTSNHVLYRVTPIFDGNNLLADGVLMEAYSVEDNGEGVCFCVYVYNVQPGIEIDYATGDNRLAEIDT